jgi:hypothetical protein
VLTLDLVRRCLTQLLLGSSMTSGARKRTNPARASPKPIRLDPDPNVCAVRTLRVWLTAAGHTNERPLFRTFTMNGKLQARRIAGEDGGAARPTPSPRRTASMATCRAHS